jgi:hypothetical protein
MGTPRIDADMLTKSRINKAIAHTGLEVWGNGDGYFYFLDKATGNQIGRCVYVCRINHQLLPDWVRDAEEARASGIVEGVHP